MKIALVCDWYRPRFGGIERHLEGLAAHLVKAGHRVTVITPTPGQSKGRDGINVIRLQGWRLPLIGLAWTPRTFRRLRRSLGAGGFDVVHAHASMISPVAYAGVYYARRLKLPVVLTLHSIWGGFSHVAYSLDLLFGWSRWPVVFSAVSKRAAKDLQALLPAGSAVRILPNAIRPEEWSPMPVSRNPELILASVMRLAPRKRGRVLLKVLAEVKRQLPPETCVRLKLAGDGPEMERLKKRSHRLGLDDCVDFLGMIDCGSVRRLLAESHLFVLPTKLESFGLAALEARATGLPVVAMKGSGVEEWLVDGVEGLLAEDDERLADCLRKLILEVKLRERIAAHNRGTQVVHTWDRTLVSHAAAYAEARELRHARQPVSR